MTRYFLITSKHNRYCQRFITESLKLNLDFQCFLYEDFSLTEDCQMFYKGKQWLGFRKGNIVMLRDGGYYWSGKIELLARWLTWIASKEGAKVLDQKWWQLFPFSIDKYWQALEFKLIGAPHLPTSLLKEWINKEEKQFPIIVKPRIGAGGKRIRIVEREDQLKSLGIDIPETYIVQPYKRLSRDVRVLIIGGRVLGSVRRRVKVYEDGRLGVKVIGVEKLNKQEIKAIKPFLEDNEVFIRGIDLLTSETGEVWVGEINLSPIFDGFERETGINVVKEIVTAWERLAN